MNADRSGFWLIFYEITRENPSQSAIVGGSGRVAA